jgi:hypothetical protein
LCGSEFEAEEGGTPGEPLLRSRDGRGNVSISHCVSPAHIAYRLLTLRIACALRCTAQRVALFDWKIGMDSKLRAFVIFAGLVPAAAKTLKPQQ